MKDYWEKIVLAAVLGLTVALAGYWAMTYPTRDDLRPNRIKGGKEVKEITEQITSLPQQWTDEGGWTFGGEHRFFRPQDYWFFPQDSKIKALKDPEQIINGMKLGWIRKYGLNLRDPRIDAKDPDGDGFTNKVEHDADTNPNDPSDRPEITNLLRLASSEVIPFKLKFRGVLDKTPGKEILQINIVQPGSREESKVIPIGEVINGYKVIKYDFIEREITVKNSPPFLADVSEITLVREDIGDKVILVKGQDKASPDYKATFVVMLPPNPRDPIASVKRGEKFAIPKEPDVEYALQSVQPDGSYAQIVRVKDRKEFKVQKVDESDYSAVPMPENAATEKNENP